MKPFLDDDSEFDRLAQEDQDEMVRKAVYAMPDLYCQFFVYVFCVLA